MAERYLNSKGSISKRENIKHISNIIEDKINAFSLEADDMIFKYESQGIYYNQNYFLHKGISKDYYIFGNSHPWKKLLSPQGNH